MKIRHIVATMFNTEDFSEFIQKRNIQTCCTVVNQGDKEGIYTQGENVWVDSLKRGLSRSRNEALDHAEADIIMIADDDIIYSDNYLETVTKAYEEYPDADMITFRITVASESHDRIQNAEIMKHTNRTILSIGSNEITFKKASIDRIGLRFDERFGLGSKQFISGEESLLLKKALDSGLKLIHYPVIIADHPVNDLSNSHWDKNMIYTKGAFFGAYSHHFASLFALIFWITKKENINKDIHFMEYMKLWNKGIKAQKKGI